MDIKNVCVIGAGTMGSGIAQICAINGYTVNLVDLNTDILEEAKNSIKENLNRFFISKGKITEEEGKNVINKINLLLETEKAVKDVQMVIEAVFEDMNLKQNLFSDLDNLCENKVILASNTSSLSITDIASKAKNQERIVGIHFFNPAPIMKLIELVKGEKTSKEVIQISKNFSESLNKTVVIVNDAPGFVTTRLIYVLCNEAIKLLEGGIAKPEDIDTACKLAFNFPMGPIELSDLVGNDIYYHVGKYLGKELGKFYKPSPKLKELVDKNLLGRKTKKGFYTY
ncbi:MAG: 3-hydroxyacyl-CoA dehydrogenase family protein [Promethearchaeati archaeon]